MIYTVVWTVQSSALVAQTSHSGFESESLPYVPGSAWRGAAAGAYLTAPGAKASDERFRRLFLEDQVHYGDLRPQGLDVWPLSVRRCKDRPEEHATVDALLRPPRRCSSGMGGSTRFHETSGWNRFCGASTTAMPCRVESPQRLARFQSVETRSMSLGGPLQPGILW